MPIDIALFLRNRSAIPLEELDKYAGQWVAWSPEGTHIVAGSSVSREALDDLIVAAGYKREDCVIGYIPGDEAIIGSL